MGKKTNAMRALDTASIPYGIVTYDYSEDDFDGVKVANSIGLPCQCVYKTLVTKSGNGDIVVCCIPVDKTLDLKALASAGNHKKLDMISVKDILALTGYVRGGCSPVGMKRKYPTYLHNSALEQCKIAVSAGVRGMQMLVEPKLLAEFLDADFGSFALPQ